MNQRIFQLLSVIAAVCLIGGTKGLAQSSDECGGGYTNSVVGPNATFTVLGVTGLTNYYCLGTTIDAAVNVTNTDGAIITTITDENCNTSDSTNPCHASLLLTNCTWTASVGSWSTNGHGTSASFTPTNCGSGTVKFHVVWTNACGGTVGSDDKNGSFDVVQLKIKTDSDMEFLCKDCSMILTADVCPPISINALVWSVVSDNTGKAVINPTSGSATLLALSASAANGTVTIKVENTVTGCSDTKTINVWGADRFPPRIPASIFLPEITQAEVDLAKINWDCLIELRHVKSQAEKETKRLFTNEFCQKDPNIGNAFLHAYWMCLVAQQCGADLAKKLGDAHEAYAENNCRTGEVMMDLHNNQIGINCGKAGGDCSANVLNALRNGRGRWMIPPLIPCSPQFQSNGGTGNSCMPQ